MEQPQPSAATYALGDVQVIAAVPRAELSPSARSLLLEFYDADRLERVLAALPQAPDWSTLRVNELQLKRAAAVAQLNGQLEAGGWRAEPHAALPDALLIRSRPAGERLAVPPGGRWALLDTTCAEAVLRGAPVFAAGVLAAPAGLWPGQALALLALASPAGPTVPRGAVSSAALLPGRPLVHIANGEATISRAALFGEGAAGLAIRVTASLRLHPPLEPERLPLGCFVQNLPSMLVAHALAPQSGWRVADLCAAPGGKATHLAQLMKDQGRVIACDRVAHKVEQIRALATRLNLRSVHAQQMDARLAGSGKSEAGELAAPRSCHAVLLDPPCSGLGQRPRFADLRSAKELRSCAEYQHALFDAATRLLQPGAVLVYSTCTLNPLENEGVVARALTMYPQLRLEPLPLPPAVMNAAAPPLSRSPLSPAQAALCARFEPGSGRDADSDTIGFFVARMRWTADDAAETDTQHSDKRLKKSG